MSTDFLDWLSEQLLDNEMRVGFGAEKIKTALALALLDARESRGLSQSQLAELCGVSQAYISKLESGEANPTIGKIGSIFAAMWMKPSIGFGPLMPERSNSEPADTEASRVAELHPDQTPPVTVGATLDGRQSSQTATVED